MWQLNFDGAASTNYSLTPINPNDIRFVVEVAHVIENAQCSFVHRCNTHFSESRLVVFFIHWNEMSIHSELRNRCLLTFGMLTRGRWFSLWLWFAKRSTRYYRVSNEDKEREREKKKEFVQSWKLNMRFRVVLFFRFVRFHQRIGILVFNGKRLHEKMETHTHTRQHKQRISKETLIYVCK